MPKKLTDYRVLVFGCYGTLIDWEAGILQALAPLIQRAGRSHLKRHQMLETYALEEATQQIETPAMVYPQLLAQVHTRMARRWRVESTQEEANIFGASVPDWPAFADSAPSLQYLQKFHKLVVLSNVDRLSFRSSQARLGVSFDAVYTAQDIGSYKPARANFEYMLDRLARDFGHSVGETLCVAQSLFHDHAPANAVGMDTAWIGRRHSQVGWGATPPPASAPRYDFFFESLATFVQAHQEQLRSD